ncbi:rhomboid family intramembrane serine protease [Bacteroides thetaiotaomicron]|nr:rhomboid family intramembrane serine protease [Bacteroides thetaiotaomicron]
MAFRLRPLHEDKLHFADLSNTQILILALEASQKLEWNIEGIALREVIFYVPMGIHSQGEEVTFTIEEGNSGEISVRSQCASVQLVDYGKNRKNIQKLQETMEEIKSALTPEELAQKANELEEELTRPLTEEERRLQAESEKESSFIHFFIPRKGFIATPVLIDINILVFILMAATGAGILEPSTLALLNWGADFGPLTLTGDWWRAVTCNFVHIGAFHLLMNMYAFIYIGIWLEHLIGTRRMFVSYLLTGLCSAVFSLYMHAETISAGASGSIFGLYGIFLAFLLFHRIERSQRKALLTSILIFVGYNLIYGIRAGVDNAAHIGGLLSGFLLGFIYVFGERMKKPEAGRTVSIIGELIIFSVFLFSFLALCRNIPSTYQEIRNEWKSGLVEAYYKEQEEEQKKSASRPVTGSPRKSSTSEQFPYTPMSDEDTWLSCYDAVSKFSCQYPTNWYKITGTKAPTPDSEPPLLKLVNGGSQLTVTSNSYDTQDEFKRMKKLLLTLPPK